MEKIYGTDEYKDFAITVENNQGKVFTIKLLDPKQRELLTKRFTIQPKVEYQLVNSSDAKQETTRETYHVSLAQNDSITFLKTVIQKASEFGNPPETFYGVALERSLGSEKKLIPPEIEEMMPQKHGTAHISYKSYLESIEINKEWSIRGTDPNITIKYICPTGAEQAKIACSCDKAFTTEDIDLLIASLKEKYQDNPFINNVIGELISFNNQLKSRTHSDKSKLEPLSFESLERKTEKSLAEIISNNPNLFIDYLKVAYGEFPTSKTNNIQRKA